MMATSLILPQSFQGLKLGDQVSMDIEREPVWGMSMNTLELNTSFYVCTFFSPGKEYIFHLILKRDHVDRKERSFV